MQEADAGALVVEHEPSQADDRASRQAVLPEQAPAQLAKSPDEGHAQELQAALVRCWHRCPHVCMLARPPHVCSVLLRREFMPIISRWLPDRTRHACVRLS